MFDPTTPRLFALPPGVDYPKAVVDGLIARMQGHPPEALARVTLYVNTRRMQRRLAALFDTGSARLLPRIRLVTDLGRDAAFADLPPAVSPLRRRLELAELVARLLDRQPDLAPRAAIYSLADSLASLVDEMQGEGIDPDRIRGLDVSDLSGHWQRSLTFLDVVERFFGEASGEPPDLEARQRRVIERLVRLWRDTPPEDPVLMVGSTGSRGATALLMQAVAQLPQGAVILPGFDTDQPADVWDRLWQDDGMPVEDHPQFRFAKLLKALGTGPGELRPWIDIAPVNPRRNALVSLALRPAPVTDRWQAEGPAFKGVAEAAAGLTLIEAPGPRAEAATIALVLRDAVERGTATALITPDRGLTRQVTAALDRWGIEPDDSAGRPLPLTPPGRLLRQVADLTGTRLTAPALLALLKHPLTNTGSHARGEHLRHTRDLELEALRRDMPYPTSERLRAWARDDARRAWTEWLAPLLDTLAEGGTRALQDHVTRTLALAERFAAGPTGDGSGALWEKAAGREARRITDELHREAGFGGHYTQADFRDLFAAILQKGEVRDPIAPHPLVQIWGTLEARVQGVDRVILAGLNDGTWPELPTPDPWMNRRMRHDAGLLLPERRIGLSAHDFQQAIAVREVVLTRAIRNDESETVPSRWLNRLTNLMHGMSEDGKAALEAMRARGANWLASANALEAVTRIDPAPRPSPRPPLNARPKQLSVTRIAKLVRDPYAIYAEKVLGLTPLWPLNPSPDAPSRGTILHEVMERFVNETPSGEDPRDARERLMAVAEAVLEDRAPWPAARVLWLAKLARIADGFLADEAARRTRATPAATEARGKFRLNSVDFTLTASADRIDRSAEGALYIYDYKTGTIPTKKQQQLFDKQLLLEAVIAEAGGFADLAPAPVMQVAYIGLGANTRFEPMPVAPEDVAATGNDLQTLIRAYHTRAQGYTARRMPEKQSFAGDYDHLSRFGEWDLSTPPDAREVGE
ncbi:MAG: double-strand break repair protein AddB [Rhodobacterales bacterium]|nr:MAG: double-strand break repair protein AddB [Rhodobacterales bacterium]